jgi:TolA-binding protein
MQIRYQATAVSFFILSFCFCLDASAKVSIRSARDDIAKLRYEQAEQKLVVVIRESDRDDRLEALFLLAGLKQSADLAEQLYHEIIDTDPDSQWAIEAYLELAKIRYALGDYGETLRILEDSYACDESDEACMFLGLSAIMLERYSEARRPLTRVKRGKFRPWAYLSLAEIEMALDNPEEACQRYQAMANTMINPTALYRHAECLEKNGDAAQAKEEYQEVIRNFRHTPEAVLASEKLQLISRTEMPPDQMSTTGETDPDDALFSEGYTLQFGSFRDRYNAIKLAGKLKQVFPSVRIDSDLLGWREVHRVRLGFFKTRDQAVLKGEEVSRKLDDEFVIMNLP